MTGGPVLPPHFAGSCKLATGERLSKQLGIPLKESPHAGAEFVDDLGRTYDALGRPAASKFWNPKAFFKSIDAHLLKSNDLLVAITRIWAVHLGHRSASTP
jgi:hypothetical protein